MSPIQTAFTQAAGVQYPLICGPMYPCSNAELVAAVSAAGGLGVVQPISMIFVYKMDLREGLRWIKAQTPNPFGMNILIEKSSKVYEDRMKAWLEIALEEGVKFFITSLGNPKWVVEKVHAVGGLVYHDVTERKWALKALDANVDGLICVNGRAGGHAGQKTPRELFEELQDLGKPLICAGGVGDEQGFREALQLGYAGVQMGTRFIASQECHVHADYKQAIVKAGAEDIVLTDKLSGTPCAIIKTPHVEKVGIRSGWLARKLLKGRKSKYLMRTIYGVLSLWKLKHASLKGASYQDYWQAGQSVAGIHAVEPAGEIVRRFVAALEPQPLPEPLADGVT